MHHLLATSSAHGRENTPPADSEQKDPQHNNLDALPPAAPEAETQNTNNLNAPVRKRLQVLVKEELKDLLKANNVIGTGVNKRSKEGMSH